MWMRSQALYFLNNETVRLSFSAARAAVVFLLLILFLQSEYSNA